MFNRCGLPAKFRVSRSTRCSDSMCNGGDIVVMLSRPFSECCLAVNGSKMTAVKRSAVTVLRMTSCNKRCGDNCYAPPGFSTAAAAAELLSRFKANRAAWPMGLSYASQFSHTAQQRSSYVCSRLSTQRCSNVSRKTTRFSTVHVKLKQQWINTFAAMPLTQRGLNTVHFCPMFNRCGVPARYPTW